MLNISLQPEATTLFVNHAHVERILDGKVHVGDEFQTRCKYIGAVIIFTFRELPYSENVHEERCKVLKSHKS